jgi:c-di-GMP-binding flagellar brake protein YcgR
MAHKRIHVRVPLDGEATLSNKSNPKVKARAIDISKGGVAVTAFPEGLSDNVYRIDILIQEGQNVQIVAKLLRVDNNVAGFQTLQIDQKSQDVINELVSEYQKTPDFIKQLDEFNMLGAVDEEGNEIEITFEKNSDLQK